LGVNWSLTTKINCWLKLITGKIIRSQLLGILFIDDDDDDDDNNNNNNNNIFWLLLFIVAAQ